MKLMTHKILSSNANQTRRNLVSKLAFETIETSLTDLDP